MPGPKGLGTLGDLISPTVPPTVRRRATTNAGMARQFSVVHLLLAAVHGGLRFTRIAVWGRGARYASSNVREDPI